jgi:hypothetical protein
VLKVEWFHVEGSVQRSAVLHPEEKGKKNSTLVSHAATLILSSCDFSVNARHFIVLSYYCKMGDLLLTEHVEFSSLLFLLWPDDGPYKPKLVAKNVFLENEVLDLTVELIRINILL